MDLLKALKSKKLLNIYFIFQCFITLINIPIFMLAVYCSIMNIWQYETDNPFIAVILFITGTLIIILSQLQVLLTPISAIATFKTRNNKELTKLEKLSVDAFPITTVFIYVINACFFIYLN